jgi:hypothetical protein
MELENIKFNNVTFEKPYKQFLQGNIHTDL